ncbi:hypothetical protein LTS08_003282 [Lithohypha guttulata]|uniref:uncharacterized protein n=1 Tax=Lithohypha guttulata TaxID=1690604 RepID=UPI002DDE2454|nr:hypothetical protein LTR51_000062 [Lithohypha guttulata]KAK5103860.1 hypothetical protein LTS08_003282 [Lithohypha guttulata]
MSYIVPIHRPSGARLALKLNLLGQQSEALVVAKANRLEIYTFSPESGLILLHSRAVYGYIIMLEAICPKNSAVDHLFVGTDRHQYFTCSWDAQSNDLKTEQSYVDQADRTASDTRNNDRVHIDPTRRFMTLELLDGIITVIPLVQSTTKKLRRDSSATSPDVPGTLGEPIAVRVEEIAIRASTFADTEEDDQDNPSLALLWEDNQNEPQLKVLELKYSTAGEQPLAELQTKFELRDADQLDRGVSHIIPVSHPYGGFLILGERSIAYTNSELSQFYTQPLGESATAWACWTKVDDLRWLIADDYGDLYFLMLLTKDRASVKNWKLDRLGHASKASCLIYLDEGLVFVGSHSGDSQVLRIHEGGIDVVQTLSNIAPILDVQLMDLGRGVESAMQSGEFSTGQARLVTCSGAWQDGSIRSVRSGVGMEEIGEIAEIPLIADMWALSSTNRSDQHDVLVTSFATETRVFKFDADAAVEEVEEFYSFELAEPTLLATNLPGQKILQVHDSGMCIADLDSGMTVFQWKPSTSTAQITGAAANGAHVLVIEDGRTIHVFHTSDRTDGPTASKTFEAGSQISGVAISQTNSNICIVSYWQSASLALLDLHSLEILSQESLGTPGIDVPRTILLAQILPDGAPTLFVSMADGTVITFQFDAANLAFSSMTRIQLGSEPVFLKALPRATENGQTLINMFASCEQPSLIYASDGRILYSAINSEQAARVCPFNSEAYPGAIAVASADDLKLALIDTTRTTQIQTLHIGETVRCLAYQSELKMFGMGTIKRTLEQDAEQPHEELHSFVKIADEITFKDLDTFALDEGELVECIAAFPQQSKDDDPVEAEDHDSIFVVGTSIMPENGAVSKEDRGRILVFTANNKRQKLKLVSQVKTRGACRSIAVSDGLVIAGLVKVVAVFSMALSNYGEPSYALTRLTTYRTSTNPISLSVQPATEDRPMTIAVGDLMKSVSIVNILPPDSTDGNGWETEEVARHFATLWTSAVANVAEREWALADVEGNIAMLRQNPDAYGDEARRLEVTGELRLGEVVNKIVPIVSSQSTFVAQTSEIANKGKGRTGSTTTAPKRQFSLKSEDAGPLIRPQAFIATVEGSIYLLGAINPTYVDALLRIQSCLSTRVLAPGYMPWAKYRAWSTEVREVDEPFRFVDGEMVESGLLNLPDNTLNDVLRESGLNEQGLSIEKLKSWGEDLRRLY